MTLWQCRARRLYRHAVWVYGDGPYALLAHCRQLSITLWGTRQEADYERYYLLPCGGGCTGESGHEVVDLRSARERLADEQNEKVLSALSGFPEGVADALVPRWRLVTDLPAATFKRALRRLVAAEQLRHENGCYLAVAPPEI
jgi:hypothetical protein